MIQRLSCFLAVTVLYSIILPACRATAVSQTLQDGMPESTNQCFASKQELLDAVDAYLLDGSEDTEVANTYGWPIGTWCVDSITDFDDVFSAVRNRQALQFNEDISAWNVGRATRMNRMFFLAASFDQDLCEWRDSVDDSVSVNFMFRGTDCQNTRAPNLESFCSACEQPTGMPSTVPSMQPKPSVTPSALPSRTSSETPSQSQSPSGQPSLPPTLQPEPSREPSGAPSKSLYPTRVESQTPSFVSSFIPTVSVQPSVLSSVSPSNVASGQPSLEASMVPTQSRSPTQPPTTLDPTIVPSETPTASESPTLICSYVVLDFETLSRGEYVTNQLEDAYGVVVSAFAPDGGYTPGGAARVFDSSNPGTVANGDLDLGSPNENCEGGGTGKGDGGGPLSPFANCDPQGMILIVQESDKALPDDNAQGGTITFSFVEPVYLEGFSILDIDDFISNSINVTKSDGSVVTFVTSDSGDNGLFSIGIDVNDVIELAVIFPSSGSIADVRYYRCLGDLGSTSPSAFPSIVTAEPTSEPTAEPTPEPLVRTREPTYYACPCVVLDFDDLPAGEYVTDQLEDDYYVTIRAYAGTGGYTPGGAGRVFDTSNPGTTANGDPDLGSPNEACPGGGPGKGPGGAPGMPFSNCDPLGNVLIVQESDKPQPDDNAAGGTLTFTFTQPVSLDEVTILDIDDHDVIKFRVEASDGTRSWIQTWDTGHNAVIPNAINIDDVVELKVYFPSSGAIAEVRYCLCPEPEGTPDPTAAPTVSVTSPTNTVPTESPTTTCPLLHMNFEELTRGQYVTDDLFDDYKVTIEARAARVGYTPNGAARAFDTALPGTNADGDPDLGSPNEMCPGGGPGVGEGGEPGAPYPNCDPQGMVLIIQESDKPTPDDVSDGGILTFDFYTPVYLVEIAILDIDEGENNPSVNVTDTSGQLTTYDLPTIGNNGVYPLQVGVDNVTQVMVWFPLGGAVAHVDYYLCPEPTATPTGPVPIGSPTPSLVTSAVPTAAESPSVCPLLHLDFEELSRGQYVTDDLFDDYKVTIEARADGEGYTPGGAARAFDTSNPGTHPDGDADLGSPNENCPGGGPGVGEGGGPDAPYPNCVPLGMVLIIQESDKPTPDDVAEGGTISFDFDIPVYLVELAILDIDDGPDPPVVRITDISGTRTKFEIPTVGNNGLYPLQINMENVVQAKVYFPANGAVAHLDYFPCPDRRRHV